MISNIGCSKVIVESDCLELVEACNGKSDVLGPNATILVDCFQIAPGITSIEFKHQPREANGLAHYLARFSYDAKRSCEWINDPPDFLLSHVIHDVTLPLVK